MRTHQSHKTAERRLWARIVPMSALALMILIASNDPAAAAREHKSRGGSSGKANVTQNRGQQGGGKANREVRRSDTRRSEASRANVQKRSEVRRQPERAAASRSRASAPKQTAPRRERAQVQSNRVEHAPSRSQARSTRVERAPSKSSSHSRTRVERAPSKSQSHGRSQVDRAPSRSNERRDQIQRDGQRSQRQDVRKHSDRSHSDRSYDRDDHSWDDGKRSRSNYDRRHYDARWRSREVVHRKHPREVHHVQKWYSHAQNRWSADIHIVGRPAYECYRPVRYVPSRVVYWYDRPYYSYATLGIYFPRFWIDFVITDAAPYGYAFYDPYCDDFFPTVSAYREHLHYYDHAAALDVVYIDDIAYDPVYVQRTSSPWWSIEIGGHFD